MMANERLFHDKLCKNYIWWLSCSSDYCIAVFGEVGCVLSSFLEYSVAWSIMIAIAYVSNVCFWTAVVFSCYCWGVLVGTWYRFDHITRTLEQMEDQDLILFILGLIVTEDIYELGTLDEIRFKTLGFDLAIFVFLVITINGNIKFDPKLTRLLIPPTQL